MHRTFWVLLWGAVVGATLQAVAIAADGVKPAAAPTKGTLGVESQSQANFRHSRFKLDIAKGEPAAAAGQLTIEQLSTMLESMGYEPKVGQYDDGSKYIVVAISRGAWNISVSMDFSPDKSILWFSVFLTKVNDPAKVPIAAAIKLLDAEQAVWPSYFVCSEKFNTIYIYRPVPNTNIKPATLRTAIDAYMTNIDSTSAAWGADAWNPK